MNTYKWNIKQLDYVVEQNGKSNVVTNIHWGVVATSDQIANSTEAVSTFYQANSSGVCAIDLNESSFFTNYAELKEDQVLQWLTSKLGDITINAIQKSLDSQIENLINPPIKSGIPWKQD